MGLRPIVAGPSQFDSLGLGINLEACRETDKLQNQAAAGLRTFWHQRHPPPLASRERLCASFRIGVRPSGPLSFRSRRPSAEPCVLDVQCQCHGEGPPSGTRPKPCAFPARPHVRQSHSAGNLALTHKPGETRSNSIVLPVAVIYRRAANSGYCKPSGI